MSVVDNLVDLPFVVLRHIATFLAPEDVGKCSLTCGRLYDVLPHFLIIRGPDFKISGPGWGLDYPEAYFIGPPLTRTVKRLKISVTWRDQGWGNRKGDIFFFLKRGSATIAEKRQPLGIAPHKEEDAHTVITDEPIVTKAEPGDYYEFQRKAGGGGGHRLIVKNYKVIVEYR